ncbi:MAG TPA: L-aspartate oxidase [Gemmatimonadaceae bacterium]|nr:L-aspartate oxidase [Gemmatimonadaceae bacterium]
MSIRNSAAVSSHARESSEAPATQSQSNTSSDARAQLRARVLVIGSGIAGLHTAMRAAEQCTTKGDVVLLTKRSLFDSSTNYAQGGIAAALGAGDSPALHRQDTLAAGGTLVDSDAVDVLVSEGPSRVRELTEAGAHFDVNQLGEYLLGREAAHSERRIVHASGDRTGAEIVRTLVERVRADERIAIVEHARALSLIIENGECAGARVSMQGRPLDVIANATVLATGGCGQVYLRTTNPPVATGDGYALANRAGAELADMEFVQFHPTALDTNETPLALISEAVRGEGAVLLDANGVRFMPAVHELAELAPRDIVTRAVVRAQRETGRVFLDATKMGESFATRFPGIFAVCMERGIDPRVQPIPVTPAAHYMMGGIVVDLVGRSTIPRLYAVGEVARTGVHGANRLASNSLLEGLVFAERVAHDVMQLAPLPHEPVAQPWSVPTPPDRAVARDAANRIRTVMWLHAGIERSASGLRICLAELEAITSELSEGATEERNLALTARLITEAALMREESRGGHFRVDFPLPRGVWAERHVQFGAAKARRGVS